MPYIKYELPNYPCGEDIWDRLAAETRPIVVYGMGNGADKLIKRFDKYGIKIADFFASDGFVRGHSFHGMRVKSFSEIKESYDDFVIVLSFASNRKDVLDMLIKINEDFEMYVPDMSIANEEEYFDREFYNENYNEIVKAYDSLADTDSKNAYAAMINYKLTGKMKYLLDAYSEVEEIYSLMPKENIRVAIDAGAYNGDTAREMKANFPNLKKIYAIEPDKRNFKKLSIYSEAEIKIEVQPINAAVWSECAVGEFSDSGNRNSTLSATASFEHKETEIPLIAVDSLACEKIDYIKYDVEGAEYEALVGSDSVIKRDAPTLLVSIYHRSRDVFYLVNMLSSAYPDYKLRLRRTLCVPAWEINLILTKN